MKNKSFVKKMTLLTDLKFLWKFIFPKAKYKIVAILIIMSLSNCVSNNDENSIGDINLPENPSVPQKEYTEEMPGEWKNIVDEHLPEVEIDPNKSSNNIKVKVPGNSFSERHYIEVIGLMDNRTRDIDLKYLERGDNPIAILTLEKKFFEPNQVKVFVKCNIHDLWTLPLSKVLSPKEK